MRVLRNYCKTQASLSCANGCRSAKLVRRLTQSVAPEAQKRVMRERLEAMVTQTETVACRTKSLLACFGEDLPGNCGHCDNCARPVSLFDGTVAAQKMLSAVYRTGQMFGALHIVSVLRGKLTDMVARHGHDKLPTFGIGAEQSEGYWRGVIRQLIAHGALRTESGEFASLALVTDKARPILRGETQVMLRQEEPVQPATRRRADRGPPPAPRGEPEPTGAAESLFDALRAWRATQAKAQSVPPYVIFHDTVLREIAAVRPANLDELGEIKGVGASKLQRYGAGVLLILADRQG